MGLSESFGFEERWLRRLLKTVSAEPDIFNARRINDAQFLLGGIGNRQVFALRDWALGIGLLADDKKRSFTALTPLGQLIASQDPQLEEFGTFWAIHQALCLSEQIWFYSYYANTFRPGTFARSELKARLTEHRKFSESVIEKKCITPLLHVMKSTKLGRDLGLLIARDNNLYERLYPDESRLHITVVAYVFCDWAQKRARKTANIVELSEYGAPCRYLALSAQQVDWYLDRIQDKYDKRVIWLSRTAGLNSLTFAEDIAPLALLAAYYFEQADGTEPHKALELGMELDYRNIG